MFITKYSTHYYVVTTNQALAKQITKYCNSFDIDCNQYEYVFRASIKHPICLPTNYDFNNEEFIYQSCFDDEDVSEEQIQNCVDEVVRIYNSI